MIKYKISSDKTIYYEKNTLINKIAEKDKKLLINYFNYKGYECIIRPSHIFNTMLNGTMMFVPSSFNGYVYYGNDKVLFFFCNKSIEWTYDNNKQLGFDHCHSYDIYIHRIWQTNERNYLSTYNTFSANAFYSSPEYVMTELKQIINKVVLMKEKYRTIKNTLKNKLYPDLINNILSFIC